MKHYIQCPDFLPGLDISASDYNELECLKCLHKIKNWCHEEHYYGIEQKVKECIDRFHYRRDFEGLING